MEPLSKGISNHVWSNSLDMTANIGLDRKSINPRLWVFRYMVFLIISVYERVMLWYMRIMLVQCFLDSEFTTYSLHNAHPLYSCIDCFFCMVAHVVSVVIAGSCEKGMVSETDTIHTTWSAAMVYLERRWVQFQTDIVMSMFEKRCYRGLNDIVQSTLDISLSLEALVGTHYI